MASTKKSAERAAAVARLEEKTGRTLGDWVLLVRAEGPRGRLARIDWLKREHVLGRFQAQLVADAAEDVAAAGTGSPASMIDAQYAGDRAGLRPIYAAVLARALSIGPDVSVRPSRSHVALVRNRQFAAVQPSGNAHVDLGLVLREAPRSDRLIPAVRFSAGGRFTHVVALATPSCVDGDVADWLRAAYEQDA